MIRRFVVVALLTGVLVQLEVFPAAAHHRLGPGIVAVHEPGGVEDETEAGLVEVAHAVGARWVTIHRGTLRLVSVTREDETVQEAPRGFAIPMAAMAVDPARAAPLTGLYLSLVLRSGQMVMGETSAELRGAQVGDDVTFEGWDRRLHTFRIGAVAPDEVVDWAEMVFSKEAAADFGFSRKSSVVLFGVEDEAEVRRAIEEELPETLLRVLSYSDPPDPDAVLPTVLIKLHFGEFAYRPTGIGDGILIEKAWRDAKIVTVNLPLVGPFRCHRAVVPFIRAALEEIVAEGYDWHIDRRNFQAAGGCYNPRLIRGGDKGGAISRHSWGVAIDINPSSNPYGGRVTMLPEIGDVFRRWGFAWGGGWTFKDGGHFEWTHVPVEILEG